MKISITSSHIEKKWYGYHTVTHIENIALDNLETLKQNLAEYLNSLPDTPTELNIKIPNNAPVETQKNISEQISQKDFIIKETYSRKSLNPAQKTNLNNMALFTAHRNGILLGLVSGILASLNPLKILVHVFVNWAMLTLREKDIQRAAAKYDTKDKITKVTSSYEKCALQKGLDATAWVGYGKTYLSFSCWWNRSACIGAMKLAQNDEFDLTNKIRKLEI